MNEYEFLSLVQDFAWSMVKFYIGLLIVIAIIAFVANRFLG